ncbi:hypothetical protein [Mycobacterium branderi]|nr:hypothetical protein [Mycobacterium branderi]
MSADYYGDPLGVGDGPRQGQRFGLTPLARPTPKAVPDEHPHA